MSILKNPVILSLIVSILTFILSNYMCQQNEKNKKGKKKKIKKTANKETAIILSAIAGLLTWYIATCYCNNSSDAEEIQENIINTQKGGSIPRLSSEANTKSYNLIGSGLNIPKTELKIPSVLIDYN